MDTIDKNELNLIAGDLELPQKRIHGGSFGDGQGTIVFFYLRGQVAGQRGE